MAATALFWAWLPGRLPELWINLGYGNSAAGFAERVKSVVTPTELRNWASNFLAHPPVGLTNQGAPEIYLRNDPLWRKIPAPCSEWFVPRVMNEGHPGMLVQVVSLGGFGSYAITIGPARTNHVATDRYTAEIDLGLVVGRTP